MRGKRRLKAEKQARHLRSMTVETDPTYCDCGHGGLPIVWHASCCELFFDPNSPLHHGKRDAR